MLGNIKFHTRDSLLKTRFQNSPPKTKSDNRNKGCHDFCHVLRNSFIGKYQIDGAEQENAKDRVIDDPQNNMHEDMVEPLFDWEPPAWGIDRTPHAS